MTSWLVFQSAHEWLVLKRPMTTYRLTLTVCMKPLAECHRIACLSQLNKLLHRNRTPKHRFTKIGHISKLAYNSKRLTSTGHVAFALDLCLDEFHYGQPRCIILASGLPEYRRVHVEIR